MGARQHLAWVGAVPHPLSKAPQSRQNNHLSPRSNEHQLASTQLSKFCSLARGVDEHFWGINNKKGTNTQPQTHAPFRHVSGDASACVLVVGNRGVLAPVLYSKCAVFSRFLGAGSRISLRWRPMSKARRARLLVIDVDGTLLTTDYRLTAVTRRSVQQVSDQGVQVVLASARSPRALHPLMEELSITGLAICYTGALTCRISPDPHTPSEAVTEQRISLFSAHMVLHNGLERGLSIGWYCGDAWYRGSSLGSRQQIWWRLAMETMTSPCCAWSPSVLPWATHPRRCRPLPIG